MGGSRDKQKRILFVDDEKYCLDGLRRVVHTACPDWTTHYTQNAQDALREISSYTFDAIVSDINMPGADGFEFLCHLKLSPITRDIPVIIITGIGEDQLKRQALELGAADLLNKPVSAEDLLARLRSVLKLKETQDQLKLQNQILDQKVKERTDELESAHRDAIWRLALAAEFRHEETGRHTFRVGYFSRILAEELGMSADFLDTIFWASPLHDVGKIGIPDEILLKPGKLDQDEWFIMTKHCEIGSRILRQTPEFDAEFQSEYLKTAFKPPKMNPILKMAAEIALTHHEKWNGTGYPNQIAKDNIPLPGRIVGLVDAYDALRSERPYKPAFSEEKTLNIMKADVGKHFDPMIFAAFKNKHNQIKELRERFDRPENVRRSALDDALVNFI